MVGADIGTIDPGIGHDEAKLVPGDQDIRRAAHHRAGLRQRQFDQTGILVHHRRQLCRPRSGLDLIERDHPPFRLGHDLLRYHQHIAILRLHRRQHLAQDRPQIVASRHFVDPEDGQDFQHCASLLIGLGLGGSGCYQTIKVSRIIIC